MKWTKTTIAIWLTLYAVGLVTIYAIKVLLLPDMSLTLAFIGETSAVVGAAVSQRWVTPKTLNLTHYRILGTVTV